MFPLVSRSSIVPVTTYGPFGLASIVTSAMSNTPSDEISLIAIRVRIQVPAKILPQLMRNPLLGDRREIGGATAVGYFRARSLTEGGYVAWVLRLVEIGAEGEGSCADVVEISRP